MADSEQAAEIAELVSALHQQCVFRSSVVLHDNESCCGDHRPGRSEVGSTRRAQVRSRHTLLRFRLPIVHRAAIVVFEFLFTFQQERETIWARKFTGATVIFALNRYLALLYSALIMSPNGQVRGHPLGH